MEIGTILTDSKWNLIKEITNKEISPTDLAKKTETSLANITQQLKLLEAYGIIKKEIKKKINNPGKPKTYYSINKEIIHITLLTQNFAEKKNLELDYIQKGIINLWFIMKKEDIYLMEKYFVLNEDLLQKAQGIFLVKNESTQIHILTITNKDHLHEIREKFSNKEITGIDGKKKKITSWTHTIDEIKEGLNKNEEYYLDLISNLRPIIEKENILTQIKNMKNGKN